MTRPPRIKQALAIAFGASGFSLVVIAVMAISTVSGSRADNVAPAVKVTEGVPQPSSTIELSPNQLGAIKVEQAGAYAFSVDKEAFGSVSFDEDPAVTQAESSLVAAAATLEFTNKTLARAKGLGVANGIPERELEQAISEQKAAEATFKAAREAMRALGKTSAEIDKMIATGRLESPGRTAKWVTAYVAESDSPAIRVGQQVQVYADAFPTRVFAAKVSRISATIDAVTHRATVRCALSDPDNQLRPGMLTRLIIRVQEPVEALAVPAKSIVRESDGTMTAWVTADNRHFTRKTVLPGQRKDDHVQIVAGLTAGEKVVSEGGVFLSNLLDAPPTD